MRLPDELLGLEVRELVARFFHAEEREPMLREFDMALDGGGPQSFREVRLLRATGEGIPAELARFPVVFEGQPCTMYIAQGLDRAQADAGAAGAQPIAWPRWACWRG